MKTVKAKKKNISAKPFLKWAGGKTQLLDELIKRLLATVKNTYTIDSYIEPFVGGGAMFFYLSNKKDFLIS